MGAKMGYIDSASGNSLWRGMDYSLEKRVTKIQQKDENLYTVEVKGSAESPYQVQLDLAHPRKSTCTCPFAAGRRVICKHMIAAYFTLFPAEVERVNRMAEEYEQEEERLQKQEENKIRAYVKTLTKKELQEHLANYMIAEQHDKRDRWR
jgi:hypothetical protein